MGNKVPLDIQFNNEFVGNEENISNEPSIYWKYDLLADRLQAANLHENAIKKAQRMPPFLLHSEDGSLVALVDLISNGPLLITFNNGHWCTHCENVLTDLREYNSQIEACGANIVAISTMICGTARQLVNRLNLPFPILTDLRGGYALLVGLAVSVENFSVDSGQSKSSGKKVTADTEYFIVPAPAT